MAGREGGRGRRERGKRREGEVEGERGKEDSAFLRAKMYNGLIQS